MTAEPTYTNQQIQNYNRLAGDMHYLARIDEQIKALRELHYMKSKTIGEAEQQLWEQREYVLDKIMNQLNPSQQ